MDLYYKYMCFSHLLTCIRLQKTLSFSQYVLAKLWQEGFCRFYELTRRTRWANVFIKALMFQISTYFETWTWNNISTCSLAIFSTTRLTAFCRSTSAGNLMENMPKFAQTDWGVVRGREGGVAVRISVLYNYPSRSPVTPIISLKVLCNSSSYKRK